MALSVVAKLDIERYRNDYMKQLPVFGTFCLLALEVFSFADKNTKEIGTAVKDIGLAASAASQPATMKCDSDGISASSIVSNTEQIQSVNHKEWASSCETPIPVSDKILKAFLQKLKRGLVFQATQSDIGHFVRKIGKNVVVKNCDGYGSKGVESLVRDFSSGLAEGLSCLSGLAKQFPGPQAKQWQMHAAQIAGYFLEKMNRPFTLVCETTGSDSDFTHHFQYFGHDTRAMALTCDSLKRVEAYAGRQQSFEGHDDYPGIVINLVNGKTKNSADRQADLFHEMIHHVGYRHPRLSSEFEVVFDVIDAIHACCFPVSYYSWLKNDVAREIGKSVCKDVTLRQHGAKDAQ